MQRPDQSVYAQQLEEHRLKQQREAEMLREEAPSQPAEVQAPAPRPEEIVGEEAPRIETPRAEEPRTEAPRVEAPRVQVPRVDPKELLSSAGLQMVETDASKARPPLPEPEPVRLGRPRREKPAAPEAAETELVQVETRNK